MRRAKAFGKRCGGLAQRFLIAAAKVGQQRPVNLQRIRIKLRLRHLGKLSGEPGRILDLIAALIGGVINHQRLPPYQRITQRSRHGLVVVLRNGQRHGKQDTAPQTSQRVGQVSGHLHAGETERPVVGQGDLPCDVRVCQFHRVFHHNARQVLVRLQRIATLAQRKDIPELSVLLQQPTEVNGFGQGGVYRLIVHCLHRFRCRNRHIQRLHGQPGQLLRIFCGKGDPILVRRSLGTGDDLVGNSLHLSVPHFRGGGVEGILRHCHQHRAVIDAALADGGLNADPGSGHGGRFPVNAQRGGGLVVLAVELEAAALITEQLGKIHLSQRIVLHHRGAQKAEQVGGCKVFAVGDPFAAGVQKYRYPQRQFLQFVLVILHGLKGETQGHVQHPVPAFQRHRQPVRLVGTQVGIQCRAAAGQVVGQQSCINLVGQGPAAGERRVLRLFREGRAGKQQAEQQQHRQQRKQKPTLLCFHGLFLPSQ